MTEKSKATTQP